MAERPIRTLAALILTTALSGCAATHVGDDWQCPLAQGEVCTSIAAADPAVVPEREPPRLATRTPLYRVPETEAAAMESTTGTTAESDTEPRPCAEGCNPLAWLARVLTPRGVAAEPAETEETVATADPGETPCGAGESAPESATTPVGSGDEPEPIDGVDTPCPIAAQAQEPATPAPITAAEPIDSSVTTAISCETDDASPTPVESPEETAGTMDASAAEDIEAPCADSASVEVAEAAEDAEGDVAGEPAEAAESTTTTPEDSPATAAADATPPTSDALLAPPGPDALRTGEVVGRIWIAPFVDAGGVYREGAWVRAVLAPARWRR